MIRIKKPGTDKCKNYRRIHKYGRYIISRQGDVCSLSYKNSDNPRLLKTYVWHGEPMVTLYNCKGRKHFSIKNLLEATFGDYNRSKEQWKEIASLPGYEVSNFGQVRSLNYRGKEGDVKVLKYSRVQDYYRISICGKSYAISRLVADAFCKNDQPLFKTEVDHINGNKRDNRASNLRWVTHQENVNFAKQARA